MTGFQKLYCLGLERTPAAEILPGTAGVWVETLADRFAWDRERDTARIRRAFVVLAGSRRNWPVPQDFMDALPPVKQDAIAYEVKPASREDAAKRMAEIRETLGIDGDVVQPVDVKTAAAGSDA